MVQSVCRSSVDVDAVWEAHERLRQVLSPSPLVFAEHRQAYLKLENLQITGAFKVRGAFNALAIQKQRGDDRPVVVASAGNHGKGTAWAARHFGLRATIVVPRGAPQVKIDGCVMLGASVRVHGDTFEEAEAFARQIAQDGGWRFLHPFNDPDVIAGQGTVAIELLSLEPDTVVIPIGGGSLVAGMSLVLKQHGIRVVGAQIHGVHAMCRLRNGETGHFTPAATIADGLRVSRPGSLTQEICKANLDDIVLVSEQDVRQSLIGLATRDYIVAEGAGAVAVAALSKIHARRPVAIVSGGNIDGCTLFQTYRDCQSAPT